MENTVSKTTLGLNLPTDPRWVDLAAMSMQDILTDHAFCEQKAASTIISLFKCILTNLKIVEALSPIVTEEWGHFRMVFGRIKEKRFDPWDTASRSIHQRIDERKTKRYRTGSVVLRSAFDLCAY